MLCQIKLNILIIDKNIHKKNSYNVMKNIQLYGLFRTGTNYITKLIEDNYLAKIYSEGNEFGLNDRGFCTNWKHGPYVGHMLKEEYPMVIVAKNPYSWLVSCYKYWRKFPLGPDLSNFSFSKFVKASPCYLEGTATVPFMFRAKNIMQYYWNSYYNWTSIRSTKFFLLQYEAILENPEGSLNKMADFLSLERRDGDFKNTKKNVLWNIKEDDGKHRIRNSSIVKEIKEKDFDLDYYTNKKYLDEYNDDLLKYIENEWDHNLAYQIGYELEPYMCFEKLELN